MVAPVENLEVLMIFLFFSRLVFRIDFLQLLDHISTPFWSLLASISYTFSVSFFNDFSIHFWTDFGPKSMVRAGIRNLTFSILFRTPISASIFDGFGMHFGTVLASKSYVSGWFLSCFSATCWRHVS